MENTSFGKILFFVGAIWNWALTVVFVSMYPELFSFLGMAPLENPVFLHLTFALVFVYGLGYYWVSKDTTQNHDIIMMGIIGKLIVFVICFYHWLVGNIHLLIVLAGTVDMVFVVLFIGFLRKYGVKEGRTA